MDDLRGAVLLDEPLDGRLVGGVEEGCRAGGGGADGTTFEHFQRMSDDALTEDPETGQPVERLVGGGAGLIFKGSGFYLTDYARKQTSGGEGASDGGGSKEGGAKAESSTGESAPAKKETKAASKPASSDS